MAYVNFWPYSMISAEMPLSSAHTGFKTPNLWSDSALLNPAIHAEPSTMDGLLYTAGMYVPLVQPSLSWLSGLAQREHY